MKTKFGAIIVAGSGKVGGHVASKNRSGSYLRTKVTPINPQSTRQTVVRNRLSGFATAWGALTAAQRDAWNGAVGQFKGSNVFGDVVNPSGFNLFVGLNSMLAAVGVAQISTPPVPVALPAITALSTAFAEGAGTATVTFAPTPVAADYAMLIEATPALPAGRSFVKNDFRYIQTVDAAGTSPANIKTAYEAKFGTIGAAGLQVFVRVKMVSKVTGQSGIPVVASTVIAA